MKKLVAFIMMVVCSVCFFGCGKNNVDNESINKAITHIQANELENALIVCQTMDTRTIEEGSDKILDCILEKLNYYLDYDKWTNTKYVLVDANAIDCLKIYKEILSLIILENSFTNAKTFVSLALQLEDYVAWNEYHKADDNYLTEAQNYMNQGAPYRNTNWNIAVMYYEKAYTVANNAHYHFNNSNEKGMKEAANFYKAYATLIDNTIDKRETSSTEEAIYNNASMAYKAMLQEYIKAVSNIIKTLESFPTKLY